MIKYLTVALAGFGLATSAGAVNLVTNPGFEMSVNPDLVKPAGSNDIIGWTVMRPGGVFLASAASWNAAGGDRSVELSGTGRGSVFQTVLLNPGSRYTLSFSYALDPAATRSANAIASVGVVNMGFTALFDPARSPTNMLWQTFSFDFTAPGSGPEHRLSFSGTSNTAFGVTIDNVILSVVPEPATWALMIAGFGMVGFASRRRRIRGVSA